MKEKSAVVTDIRLMQLILIFGLLAAGLVAHAIERANAATWTITSNANAAETYTWQGKDHLGNDATIKLEITPATSPDLAKAPPLASLVDAQANVWTIRQGDSAVLVNGLASTGGFSSQLAWCGGVIYAANTQGTSWWKWTGTGWTQVGTAPPC